MTGQFHAPAALSRRRNVRYPHTGDWMDPRASLNVVANRQIVCSCQESNTASSIP